MSLAVEKLKPATAREQFIRMGFSYSFAADLGTMIVQNNGGLGTWNVYPLELPEGFEATSVTVYDVGEQTLTEKDSLSLIDGWNQWVQDPATGTLYVAVETVEPEISPLVVTFRMFFKTGSDLRWYGTPDDDASDEQLWRGRVRQPVTARQSIEDLFAGIISYGETSFALADHDGLVHGLLGPGRTVNNLAVDVWQSVGDLDVSNFARLFRGRLKSPSVSPLEVSFSAYDELSILDQTATFGEDEDGHVYVPSTSLPAHVGRPIPIMLGFESYSELREIVATVDNMPPLRTLVAGTEASVETYSSSPSTSNNRTWLLGRGFALAASIGPGVGSFGTINRVLNSGFGYWFLHVSSLPANLAPGQSFVWDEGGRHYSVVRAVGAFTYAFNGLAYNLVIDRLPSHTLTTAADPFEEQCGGLAIVIKGMDGFDDGELIPIYGRDYTMDVNVDGSFTRLRRIVFASNFEANHSAPTLDPAKHTVEWAQKNTVSGTEYRHGTVLLYLLAQAGLDVGGGSTFTAANTSLAEDVYMMIPRRGEGALGSYRDYIAPILRGTLGYLTVNADDEVEYHLVAAPAAGDTYGDDVHGGIAVSVETQDIKTILELQNPDLAAATGAATKLAPNRATSRMLYGIDAEEAFVHALGPTTLCSRANLIAALKAAARDAYTLDVHGMAAIEKKIGDDVTITGTRLLGGVTSKNVKIVALERGKDGVRITAYGLEALA